MTKEKKSVETKDTFEENLSKLEEMVRKLERGELSLDESLLSYERGIELVRRCEAQLEEAKGKIQKLTSVGDDNPKAVDFKP